MLGKLKLSALFQKNRANADDSAGSYEASARLLSNVRRQDLDDGAPKPFAPAQSEGHLPPQEAPAAATAPDQLARQFAGQAGGGFERGPDLGRGAAQSPASSEKPEEEEPIYVSPGMPLSTLKRYREEMRESAGVSGPEPQATPVPEPSAAPAPHPEEQPPRTGEPGDGDTVAPQPNEPDGSAIKTPFEVKPQIDDARVSAPQEAAAPQRPQTAPQAAGGAGAGADQLLESDSHYTDTDNSGQPAQKLPLGLQIQLWLRQLCASLFTHTNLSVPFPRLSLRLGPCYPSSMPLPYLITGFVCALALIPLAGFADYTLLAGLYFVFLVLCTGIRGFTGLSTLLAMLSRRRTDHVFLCVCSLCYAITHIALFCMMLHTFGPGLPLALCCGALCMLSAWSATLLNFGLRQDPMEFYGSMSFSGLVTCTALVFAVCFTLLNPFCALALCGTAMLCRLGVGRMLYATGLRASRDRVCGAQMITQAALMAVIVACGQVYVLLNPWFFPHGTIMPW